jgi:hypothetical protein
VPYRYHSRAFVDPSNPQAWATCDRCCAIYNHKDLQFQYQFNGSGLYNTRFLVCQKCLDIPQPQLLSPILPPDPTPVLNPRPFNFAAAEVDYLNSQSLEDMLTQDDTFIVVDDASQNFGEEPA